MIPMPGLVMAVVVLGLICFLGERAGAATGDQAPVCNRPTEFTFTSSKGYRDPFNEIDLDVIFTAPDGSEQRVPAFWAGGGTWRVRYASHQPGVHRFKTICSDASNGDLNGAEGSLQIKPYTGDNPLYRHGPFRVSGDKKYFQHIDGTPFFWLGDTWWMSLTKRLAWPDDFKTLTADRVKKGFTVVQIVAGLYPDMPAFDERGANEAGFPWTRDYARINPEYFDAADRRIAHLVDSGIAPCIVGAWAYHLPWLGVERMKKHWRYIVARWGAYPGFWCIAGEGAMPYYLSTTKDQDREFQRKGLTEIARYVRSIDPQHHPISVHPTDMSRTQVVDPSVLDFEMLQTGHSDRASIPPTLSLVAASRAAQPTMPTINSEVCYEGILNSCRDDVVRFMTWSCLLAGTAGHTYGANGIWQINGRDKPYGLSPHGGTYGPTPWDEAMKLPGSTQVGIARRLLERYEWWRFQPHNEWAMYDPSESSTKPNWGHWIWFPEGEPSKDAPVAKRYFRKSFDVPDGVKRTSAKLWLAVDDQFVAYVNGEKVGSRRGWESPQGIDVTAQVKAGRNVLAIEGENVASNVPANPAGLLCSLRIELPDNKHLDIPSDTSWRCAQEVDAAAPWMALNFDDAAWPVARDLGEYGCKPWGSFSSPDTYGPFTAGTEDVRITYIPERRAIRLLHLHPNTTYRAKALDPASGTLTELDAITSNQSKLVTPGIDSTSSDWVLILERGK